MGMKERLLEKIAKRDITVGVVGLGYVGPVSYTHLDVYKRQLYTRVLLLKMVSSVALRAYLQTT